jgi:hypothetical protein
MSNPSKPIFVDENYELGQVIQYDGRTWKVIEKVPEYRKVGGIITNKYRIELIRPTFQYPVS